MRRGTQRERETHTQRRYGGCKSGSRHLMREKQPATRTHAKVVHGSLGQMTMVAKAQLFSRSFVHSFRGTSRFFLLLFAGTWNDGKGIVVVRLRAGFSFLSPRSHLLLTHSYS